MSSQLERSSSRKRSRNSGACDLCKKRKIRCDSGQTPGNRCSNCVNSGQECTHAEIMKTLGSAKGYVESLETRLEKMERLLNKLLPGIDFSEQLEQEESPSPNSAESLPRNDTDDLLGAIKKLTLNPEEHRFFGKSSSVRLLETALDFKHVTPLIYAFLRLTLVHLIEPAMRAPSVSLTLQYRRGGMSTGIQSWLWILPSPDDQDRPEYTFPDPDLLPVLVNLYFANVNCYHPILHRPTFERKLKDQLHLRDHRYAATLLMVCSLGARHCDDPRVCLDGVDSFHAAGWKWHSQVRVIPKHLIYKPNLYELQTIALSSIFLLAVSPVAWNQIGFGLRRAQDVGAHRRMKQSHPTAENEQWKRAFWVLLSLDWIAGTATGRPLAMHDEDYDQELPIECDDDYWELPEPLNFRQPKGKPSEMSFFIHQAKLLEIQLHRLALPQHFTPHDNPAIFPENPFHKYLMHRISSHLTLRSIPGYSIFQNIAIRWDPERKNPLHFNQSALLHAGYYNVQIMVHRPYIPAPVEVSRPGSMPSLTICTNAARACARIFSALDKLGIEPNHSLIAAAFTSAIVLLLHTWTGKRSGFAYNPSKEMNDVYICMKTLSAAEKRYQSAGRFNDIIVRLISVGDMSNSPLTRPYVEETAPAFAQKNYQPLKGFEPSAFVNHDAHHTNVSNSSKWMSQQLMRDFNDSIDKVQANHHAVAHNVVTPDIFSNPELMAAYNGSAAADLEQLLRMEPAMHHIQHDMLVDTDADILSMWSAAPSGFQLADWESYLMSSGIPPELNGFSASTPSGYTPSPSSQSYLR
ncbi:Zn(2)-C6 fungal-type domain-containing protein [Mycena indigotica]|uniref:Zn(2)-C6 fungal-type domain-containing protein n=1 Tax=Mycena indigotica TaxID=2126181 RepID=A0A8H6S8E3_9AGAR|nr:Zn(2)-C6 fungal-type domain-containing protein [Mycena indigotica]KAF7294890.1 Zn(2)-C6 fungal-type domain-containing protein [Mycena indigotica]